MSTFEHTVAIVASGVVHDHHKIASLIKDYGCLIAADGGLYHCHRMGLKPDMLIGDCDSIAPELLEMYSDVPIRRFPQDKNETDLELAIQTTYTPQVKKITLFGALEGRTDHSLANLHLIRRYPEKVFIETEQEVLYCIAGKTEIPCTPGQTISLIQIGDPASGITSQGLKWELQNAAFSKYFMSISNICLQNPVHLTIAEGDLICCIQKRS